MDIILLKNLKKDFAQDFGEKAAILGEFSTSFSVPIGFVLSPSTFSAFLKETNLNSKIEKLLQLIDLSNLEQLQEIANQIQKEIALKEMPNELRNLILEYYNSINIEENVDLHTFLSQDNYPSVAIRLSPIIQEKQHKMHLHFLNVKGEEKMLNAIKFCWASMFTAKSIFYRKQNNITNYAMSVIVQKMINPQFSGEAKIIKINNLEIIHISYCIGLYHAVKLGLVKPLQLMLNKESSAVMHEVVHKQETQLVCDEQNNKCIIQEVVKVDKDNEKIGVLELNKLASTVRRLEKYMQSPIQLEFAVKNGEIYVLDVFKI